MSAMRCSSLLLLATSVLLSSCEVGPNYRRPDAALINANTAKGSFVGATNAAVSEELPPDAWWQLYDDPRLDEWVRDALASNTDLRKADANLARSRASFHD